MKVWSKTIEIFRSRLWAYVDEILLGEVGANKHSSKIYTIDPADKRKIDEVLSFTIVVFEHSKMLGSCEMDYGGCSTIGINKKFMYEAKDAVIKDILRHQLAHLICHSLHGVRPKPHGYEFKKICKKFGFTQNVASPTMDITKENKIAERDSKSEKLISKVQKLISLSKSNNQHEAELAIAKANQLIMQHNLNSFSVTNKLQHKEVEHYSKVVLDHRKSSPAE